MMNIPDGSTINWLALPLIPNPKIANADTGKRHIRPEMIVFFMFIFSSILAQQNLKDFTQLKLINEHLSVCH